MVRRAAHLVILSVVLLSVSPVFASPFNFAPETYGPSDWKEPYVSETDNYQRNAVIDFTTDPLGRITDPAWPQDPGNTNAYDLIPQPYGDPLSPPNYHVQGDLDRLVIDQRDEAELWESDWFEITDLGGNSLWDWTPEEQAKVTWQDRDDVSGREGIIGFEPGAEDGDLWLYLRWHLDNLPSNNQQKNIWSEVIWRMSDGANVWTTVDAPTGYDLTSFDGINPSAIDPSLPGPPITAVYDPDRGMPLDAWGPDGGSRWWAWNFYAKIEPNPEWEELLMVIRVPGGDSLFIEEWHVATECVPEPGTFALFGLGAVGLVIWRRKKKQ